jgi:hypothetical protein
MRRGVIALDYMVITAYVDLPNASTLFWTVCVQKIVCAANKSAETFMVKRTD